jgi:hypothetical protein
MPVAGPLFDPTAASVADPVVDSGSDPIAELSSIFRAEHAAGFPDEARRVSEEIVRRHGGAVSAVLFYGSCLRKRQLEGSVLDFYAIVDSYRDAYSSRPLAAANHVLPPNVFFLSIGSGASTVLSKYAVLNWDDFIRGTEGRTLNSIVWARFCQPSRLVWCRDDAVRDRLAGACASAAVTMVRTALALQQDLSSSRLNTEALWQAGFRATYATELRTERPETIRELYAADPARYDRVAALAIEELARNAELRPFRDSDGETRVQLDIARFEALGRRWRLRSRAAKCVYVVRLVKSAFTFGDWLPYALFKLGRHTGVQIELTPLQRRYPLIFGWPVVFKLLRSQKLR